jgi:Spy/CpxP family protein refolding chaperone
LKRLSVLSLALLVLFCPLSASAQKPAPKASASTAPAPQSKRIWDYQKELNLTDNQVTQLKTVVQQFEDASAAASTKAEGLQKQVNALMHDDTSDIEQLRARWIELQTLEVNTRVMDIQTSRTVYKILSKEQMERWKQIQAATSKPAQPQKTPAKQPK